MGTGEFDVLHTIAIDSRGRRVCRRSAEQPRADLRSGREVHRAVVPVRPPRRDVIDRKTDTLYVADSESRDGRTNTKDGMRSRRRGCGFNPGIRRGIHIGSARDGSVRSFIPDPVSLSVCLGVQPGGRGVTVDAQGSVYGAGLPHGRPEIRADARATNELR